MRHNVATERLAGIEVLRFLCALTVLLWHYQHFLFLGAYDAGVALSHRPDFPFYTALSALYDNGHWAVQFFWLISGVVFFRIYAEAIVDGRVRLLDFAFNRFARLYPLHIATLLLVAVLQYAYVRSHATPFIYQQNGPNLFASQLFMASNWFAWQPFSFNGPIWSVSVEVLIYLFFFFVMRTFGLGIVVTSAAAAVSYFLLEYPQTGPAAFLNSHLGSCGLFFFTGGLVEKGLRHPSSYLAALVVTAALLVAYGTCALKPKMPSILALAASVTLLFAGIERLVAAQRLRTLAALGNATYSMYLLHFPLQLAAVIVGDRLGYDRSIFFAPWSFAAFIFTVVGAALLVFCVFEMPAKTWLRSLPVYAGSHVKVDQRG